MKTVYVLERCFYDYNAKISCLDIFEDMTEAEKAKEQMDKWDNDEDCISYKVKEYKVYKDCLEFFEEM